MNSHPNLILISGPPGVGKSTLASSLSKKLKIALLDKDCIDEPFSPNDRGENYTLNIEPKVLEALLSLVALNLKNGISLIVDLPWTHLFIHNPQLVNKINTLTKTSKANLTVLELVIAQADLKQRIIKRNLKRDQIKLSNEGWENFKKTDCLEMKNPMDHHQIDASLSPQDVESRALHILDELKVLQ